MLFCSKTCTKLANVGGLGMKTGGYAMLSISFLSESDSIHRNTKIAGETMTTTENQKPILRSQRLRAARVRAVDAVASARLRRSALRPLGLLPQVQQHERQRQHDHEEDHHDRRGVADVVEREGLQIQIEVDRLRRGTGSAPVIT